MKSDKADNKAEKVTQNRSPRISQVGCCEQEKPEENIKLVDKERLTVYGRPAMPLRDYSKPFDPKQREEYDSKRREAIDNDEYNKQENRARHSSYRK